MRIVEIINVTDIDGNLTHKEQIGEICILDNFVNFGDAVQLYQVRNQEIQILGKLTDCVWSTHEGYSVIDDKEI